MKYTDIPAQPANTAPITKAFSWPQNKKSCLFLSFDFDAETGWIDISPTDWHKKVKVSHGSFGARVGIGKILALLKELELKATFFVPAWTAEAHTQICENILTDGHEIGHHGRFHLLPDIHEMERSLEEIDNGFEILDRVLGIKPVGYRAPLGENYQLFLAHLWRNGIKYSSSWRDDILPYRHVLEDGQDGPIELPANYFFDDWMHGLIVGSGRNLLAREQILSMWNDELEITHEWGGLTTTIFHPQVSGRPSRYKILREFLSTAQQMDDLWIATGREICEHYETIEQKRVEK